MDHYIDTRDVSREREFATGCLVYMIMRRDRELILELHNAGPINDDSDDEPDPETLQESRRRILSYKRIYEAIYEFASDHVENIESEYRSFFTEHRELMEPHVKNFIELVARYTKSLFTRPFSSGIIISFCARLSVFGYMSYKAKRMAVNVHFAISSIVYILKYFRFDDSKYDELKLCAGNFLSGKNQATI